MARDKALLPLGESTFLGTLIETYLTRLDPVIVVVGYHADAIREKFPRDERVRFVVNQGYDDGMLSSLQTGLREVGGGGALFTLVDHPSLGPETLQIVADRFEREGPVALIPRYEGERGHPVAISAEVVAELLDLPSASSPKPVMRSHYPETLFLDLDDPAITQDIDLPEQYHKLIERM